MKSAFPKQEWTDHALKEVEKSALSSIEPADSQFWFGVEPSKVTNQHWVHLLAAMCFYESGCDPKQTYEEGGDLAGVVSTGLFQVSKGSVAGYGFPGLTTNQLKDPFLNIEIAVEILSKWTYQDGVIASVKSPWRGGARYWSVLRKIKNKDGSIKADKTKAYLRTLLEKYGVDATPDNGNEQVVLPRTLKLGDSGTEVEHLQQKLISLGWMTGTADGIFGPITKAAVRKFQLANDLVVDGRVGDITWRALFSGTIPTEPAPLPTTTVPKKPKTNAEAAKIFGDSKAEVESQLAFCETPLSIKCFSFRGNTGKRGFTCHKLLVPVFQLVFNEIAAKGLQDKLYSYEGVFNWRTISGSGNRSLHSYAIAIDLNYEGNELGDSTPAMDRNVVAIFKKYGFFWGGDYSGRKDGMHFEWYDRGQG